MNPDMEDVGVLQSYNMDLAFGLDENNFECTIAAASHCCEAGYFLYFEGTEYGGIIDSIKVNTETQEISYIGRTWHGILDSKILCPDAGTDYLTVTGEANAVISSLLSRLGLTSLFKASTAISGISFNNFKIDRYISGYKGIKKMLKSQNAKLQFVYEEGFVTLSAKSIVDYSQDEQFDADQIALDITKNYMPANHCICLGQGDLREREVIHLYANSSGQIGHTQSLTGILENTIVYDYPNAESSDELENGGIERLQEAWNSSKVDFDFTSDDATYDIGDIVGTVEQITGIFVKSEITKKIVTINKGIISINYKVGE